MIKSFLIAVASVTLITSAFSGVVVPARMSQIQRKFELHDGKVFEKDNTHCAFWLFVKEFKSKVGEKDDDIVIRRAAILVPVDASDEQVTIAIGEAATNAMVWEPLIEATRREQEAKDNKKSGTDKLDQKPDPKDAK